MAYPRKKSRLTDLVTPLKPLEAMAQGKLVAASDVGGHRELMTDGVTGTLFPPIRRANVARLWRVCCPTEHCGTPGARPVASMLRPITIGTTMVRVILAFTKN
jgi:hypothetical protein